jgi:hypothetical protein
MFQGLENIHHIFFAFMKPLCIFSTTQSFLQTAFTPCNCLSRGIFHHCRELKYLWTVISFLEWTTLFRRFPLCGPCMYKGWAYSALAPRPTVVYYVDLFFYLVGWELTPLGPSAGPLGSYKSQYCGHTLAYCTFSPDDTWGWLWSYWWSERRLQGEPKYSEKTCPAPLCLTTNPTCLGPVSNPGPQRWEASD